MDVLYNSFAIGLACLRAGQAPVLVFGASLTYLVALAMYRLFFSPMAQYPGPKLAALTQWVETYHELRGDGGQFFYKIEEWHNKYGPIVRISPHEVHIRDPDFYDDFYAAAHVADRRAILRNRFGIPDSTHFTTDHELHRKRRAAVNPFFSMRKVAASSALIHTLMDRVCCVVEEQYSGSRRHLNIPAMWGCFASDVIAQYAFGKSYGFIETDGFESTFVRGWYNMLEPLHIMTQFPWISHMLGCLPDWLNIMLQPDMKPVLSFNADVTKRVKELSHIVRGDHKESTADRPVNILTTILHSNLGPSELTVDRLRQEAIGIVGAGVEAPFRTLTVACYHILANEPICTKLVHELVAAMPDPSRIADFDTLRQLPYLSACIQETHRIALATTQRTPRVFRKTTPQSTRYSLVLNQPFSMSLRDLHFDPTIFPSPQQFLPDRWLPQDYMPDGRPLEHSYTPTAPSGKRLSRYVAPYARGPRNCLGMNLAECEIYIALATFIRRFGGRMQLADGITRESVDFARDRFVPREKIGAPKVMVNIH